MKRIPNEYYYAAIVAAVVFLGAVVLITDNDQQNTDIKGLAAFDERLVKEQFERRDQSCRLFEGDHLADVQSLEKTYEYLGALTPEERKTTLNKTILNGLAEQEREAKVDSAPDFCDKPNTGLPEPDPVVPTRPPSIGISTP